SQTARAFADPISRAWRTTNSGPRQHWRSPRHCRGRSLQVILVDANILIYAHVSSFAQHSIARGWLDQQLNGSGPVGLPWASMLAFLRLVTNPRVFERPEPIGDAWRQVHAWLACETAWIPQPTERHAEPLGELLALPGVHGNLYPMPIWPRWLWNTGLHCAPQTVILRGFAACVGLTRLPRPET